MAAVTRAGRFGPWLRDKLVGREGMGVRELKRGRGGKIEEEAEEVE